MSSPYAIIADSDRTFARGMRVHLDSLGFVSFVATDVKDVFGHVGQFVPGLVMLDVHLPGLGAYQACVHIRRLPGCSTLPIVLTANSNRPQITAAAQRAGASTLLVKPFSINDLMQRLEPICGTIGTSEARPANAAVWWPPGMAEPQPVVWNPPPKPGAASTAAPVRSMGVQVLDIMRRREKS
jgi:DNA-binding response OmpR family regulator